MRYYFICFFHIIIIPIILGCGYKAPPVWEVNESKKEINSTDLKIIDINSTLKVKIGVK